MAVVLVWVVSPYVEELFKYESLSLRSCWWTENSKGNITLVTLRPLNNGTKRMKITDVFVDQTLVSKTNWGSDDGVLLPGTWAWVYVTPVIVVDGWYNGTRQGIRRSWVWPGSVGGKALCVTFQFRWDSGTTYNFTLITAAGNVYTYIVTATYD